jgi:hypothetical protein
LPDLALKGEGNADEAAFMGGALLLRASVPPIAADPMLDRSDCLPPDLEYCLDAEQESFGIGHDDRAYVDIFDRGTFNWFLPLTRGGARAFADRMALTWGGLDALKWVFDGCVSDVAYQVVHHHGVSDFPDGAEVTYLQQMDIDHNPSLQRFADGARPIVARAVQDIGVAGREAFLAARGSLDALYAGARERIRARNRRVNDLLRNDAENATRRIAQTFEPEQPARLNTVQRRKEKGLRRAIARSYRLLGSIAGAETARASLDGEQITVNGRKFDFRLRVANLRSTAHGAIEVFVTDKDAVELASLCVYIDQTPALDQMAALILDVTAGNEDEIIRRANVIRSTKAAATNTAFCEIRRKVERAIEGIRYSGGAGSAAPSDTEELLPAIERRLAEAIDIAAWRPLIDIFGQQFSWHDFAIATTAPASASTEAEPGYLVETVAP